MSPLQLMIAQPRHQRKCSLFIISVTAQMTSQSLITILTETQCIPENFQFSKQEFGTRWDGNPYLHLFSKRWSEEFKFDGLVYSIDRDVEYCNFANFFWVEKGGCR